MGLLAAVSGKHVQRLLGISEAWPDVPRFLAAKRCQAKRAPLPKKVGCEPRVVLHWAARSTTRPMNCSPVRVYHPLFTMPGPVDFGRSRARLPPHSLVHDPSMNGLYVAEMGVLCLASTSGVYHVTCSQTRHSGALQGICRLHAVIPILAAGEACCQLPFSQRPFGKTKGLFRGTAPFVRRYLRIRWFATARAPPRCLLM